MRENGSFSFLEFENYFQIPLDNGRKNGYNSRVILKLSIGETMGKYQTEQKKLLLAFFASHPQAQFSAEQAASALLGEEEGAQKSPGKSTVYRLVADMASEGHLKRFPRSDGKRGWLYQYHENHACGGHLHLKCAECGCLLHLECGMSKELLAHIETTHGFHVDNSATVLYGICQNCQEGKKSSEIYN